ncbi:hypothetical protein ACA910_020147 [Epithemia clementina (nom. ined.)]
MSGEEENERPNSDDGANPAGGEEHITLSVKDQTGEEISFKIKKSTKLEKVFKAYAQRKHIDVSSIRFLIDGERLKGDSTAKMLELEDGDQIDALLEQTGG